MENKRTETTDVAAAAVAEEMARGERMLAYAERLGRVGSWEADLLTGESFWSAGLCELLGFGAKRQKPDLALFLTRLHPDDRDTITQQVTALMGGDHQKNSGHYRLQLPGVAERVIFGEIDYVQDESGRVIRLIGTCKDVTPRRAGRQGPGSPFIANDSEPAGNVATLANRSRELRESLNIISGLSEILMHADRAPLPPERGRHIAREIHAISQQLLTTLDDMIQYQQTVTDD